MLLNLTKNEIIEKIYREGIVRKHLRIYFGEYEEDLKDLEQDTYVILLKLPEEILNDLLSNNKLENYISAILRRQVRSKTSYYYKKYKEFRDKSSEIYENTTDESY